MIMLDDFQTLIRKIESIQREITEKQGANKQTKKRILDQFGCKTIKLAKKKLTKLQKEEHKLMSEYIKAKERFESKWAKQLKSTSK